MQINILGYAANIPLRIPKFKLISNGLALFLFGAIIPETTSLVGIVPNFQNKRSTDKLKFSGYLILFFPLNLPSFTFFSEDF